MTNSTPKNKIERQGSPNSQGKKSGQRSTNYTKTVTYFASGNVNAITPVNNGGTGGRNSRSSTSTNNTRQSCTPPCSSAKNIPRNSPNRYDSPRGSPTNSFYAGAKFSEPPSPASLPKPPSHWTGLMVGCQSGSNGLCHISQHFKMMVNVQA